jgi:hypothetical protein
METTLNIDDTAVAELKPEGGAPRSHDIRNG